MLFKFFIWTVEFRLKRKQNNARLLFLLNLLNSELRAVGHDITATNRPGEIHYYVSEYENWFSISGNKFEANLPKSYRGENIEQENLL